MHPPSPSQPDLELPKTIGRYEVLRIIGEGAMGRVLCAHDPVLGRDVAIKLLRSDLLVPRDVREGLLARMRNEARAAAKVSHPNLVTLHDMGEDPTLGLYLVFEYVEGKTLKDRLKESPLSPGDAARLARELGSALTFAHNEGILHRDIKPENVILSRTGGKIADFGIARIPNSTLTHAGGLMGTPAYSAPETFGGKNFSPASDQFSLAASLYEAIRGERAFPGDDAVEVAAHIAHDPPERFASRRGLPQAVDDVFARALAKAPIDRYPSCEALGEALYDALAPAIEPAPRATSPSAPNTLGTPGTPSTPGAFGAQGRGSAPSIHETRPRASATSAPEEQELEPQKLPTERKRNEILLGAAAVAVTAALLIRTATQQQDTQTPAPSASASTTEPSASADKPKSAASSASTRPLKPRTTAEPQSPDAATSAPTNADAGPSSTADAGPAATSSAPGVSSAPAPTSSASAPPGSPPSPAPVQSTVPPAKQPGSSP